MSEKVEETLHKSLAEVRVFLTHCMELPSNKLHCCFDEMIIYMYLLLYTY